MIVAVDESNILQAAAVHAASWRASHRLFCSPEFVAAHTVEHQQDYLREKIQNGSRFYLLVEGVPAGVVSVTGSSIEDLYVIPEMQGRGIGTHARVPRRSGYSRTTIVRGGCTAEWALG